MLVSVEMSVSQAFGLDCQGRSRPAGSWGCNWESEREAGSSLAGRTSTMSEGGAGPGWREVSDWMAGESRSESGFPRTRRPGGHLFPFTAWSRAGLRFLKLIGQREGLSTSLPCSCRGRRAEGTAENGTSPVPRRLICPFIQYMPPSLLSQRVQRLA